MQSYNILLHNLRFDNIATDRYQNIIYPMKALKRKKNPRLLVFLVWLFAIVISIPSVMSMKSVSLNEIPKGQGMGCENAMGQVSTTWLLVFTFLVPLIVIFVLYTKIAFFLHQRIKIGMIHEVAARSNSKAVRMLTVAVLAYTLFLGPLLSSPCWGLPDCSTAFHLTTCWLSAGRSNFWHWQVHWEIQ